MQRFLIGIPLRPPPPYGRQKRRLVEEEVLSRVEEEVLSLVEEEEVLILVEEEVLSRLLPNTCILAIPSLPPTQRLMMPLLQHIQEIFWLQRRQTMRLPHRIKATP